MRQAFVMRLKPGALPAYRDHHAAVWPELEAAMAAAGIERFSIFEADPILVISSEVTDHEAWPRLWATDVHQRWSEVMEPLLEVGPDGVIESVEMREVYRVDVVPGA
jgi:L-rhamnose mutarotase